MKARIHFHCAAVVALVLILAATPSKATERRDPPIVQDATQTQASSAATHATAARKHSPKSALKQKRTSTSSTKKNSTGSGQNASNAHAGAASGQATK